MNDTDRQFLFDLRKSLLHLHKTLLDWERAAYERVHGRVSPTDLLHATMEHPQFAWLRPISVLIVRIDETVETEDGDAAVEVDALLARARELVTPAEAGTPNAQRYLAALQEHPDAVLAQYGFGRAHHRVLHFVHRNPGLRVANLLEILKITKQSLARVLKQLIGEGFVTQRAGAEDRRERLLYVTVKGARLAEKLTTLQTKRVEQALAKAGTGADAATRRFLLAMIAEADRPQVEALVRMSPANPSVGEKGGDE